MRALFWTRLSAVLLPALLLIFSAGPAAYAHTNTELDSWRDAWGRRVLVGGLTVDRLVEYADMVRRHPCWLPDHCHQPRAVARAPARVYAAGVEQWRPLVETYFAADQVERAMRIMACESGGNPNAKSPISSASGLMQHLGKYWSSRSASAGWAGASIWDPEANIAVAAWLQRTGSWSHWVCR